MKAQEWDRQPLRAIGGSVAAILHALNSDDMKRRNPDLYDALKDQAAALNRTVLAAQKDLDNG